MKEGSLGKRIRKHLPFYFMMLPAILYLFINNYMPMPGLVMAFKKYNVRDGMYGSPWVGFLNFEYLFTTNEAWVITRNTILYNLAFIVLGTVCAVGVAVILNDIVSKRRKKTYQTILLRLI